jgi:hypothetical protein
MLLPVEGGAIDPACKDFRERLEPAHGRLREPFALPQGISLKCRFEAGEVDEIVHGGAGRTPHDADPLDHIGEQRTP